MLRNNITFALLRNLPLIRIYDFSPSGKSLADISRKGAITVKKQYLPPHTQKSPVKTGIFFAY